MRSRGALRHYNASIEWRSSSRHIAETIAPPTGCVNQSYNERWMDKIFTVYLF